MMNTLKSLLLGSAAALVVATGAQAASAPGGHGKYGSSVDCPTGFWNTAGTDVCLRVSGFARLVIYGWNDDARPGSEVDDTNWYSQARVRFDARRQTDLGLMRTYAEVQASDSDGNTGGDLALRLAFVQLGNWVAGKAVSSFTHGNSTANGSDFTPTGHTIRVSQIRYTTSFGDGLSLSLALENPHYEDQDASTTIAAAQARLDAANGAESAARNEVTRRRQDAANTQRVARNDNAGAQRSADAALDQQEVAVAVVAHQAAIAEQAAATAALSAARANVGKGSDANDIPTFVAALNYASGPLDTQVSVAVVNNEYAGSAEDGAGFAVGFGAGYELTDSMNLIGKVVYTNEASQYQMDVIGSPSNGANEEILSVQGGASMAVNDDLTLQAVAGWADVSAAQTGAAEGNVWHAAGLFSWRPVSGMDILGEIIYRETDSDLSGGNEDKEELIGGLSILANLN